MAARELLDLHTLSTEELRRYTVRQLCESQARVVRAHPARHEERRILLVGIEWDPDATLFQTSIPQRIIESALARWVWDGWGVYTRVGTEAPPPPPLRPRYELTTWPRSGPGWESRVWDYSTDPPAAVFSGTAAEARAEFARLAGPAVADAPALVDTVRRRRA